MKRPLFKLVALAMAVFSVALCVSPAFATFPNNLDPNSNYSGWKLRAGREHMGSKNCTYTFYNAEAKSAYESYFNAGKALWGSAINMTYRESAAKGYITYDSNPDERRFAVVESYSADGSGHCTGYVIKIFTQIFDYPQNGETHAQMEVRKGKVFAHEIGHVYGLYDAPDDRVGQIMHTRVKHNYAVTSADLAGMSIVTHSHTHNSSTAYTCVNTGSSSIHKHRCNTCKAYFGQSSHTWVTNGKTGNNYHSGRLHFYEYYQKCSKCGKGGPSTYLSIPCSGPPCNTTTSIGVIDSPSVQGSLLLPL